MGEVFRARDDRIGRDVAIKILPSSFAADADRLKRFEQEARSAGTLNHPNLVTIYDIGRENGAPYIVMELLDGATLREKFDSHAELKKNLLAIADAADAIAAAHRAGVIHRDLKPENIIVTRSGYTKVLDFGLAKLAGEGSASENTQVKQTDPGMVLGTAGYMSPEQAEGKPADARSDIFALGCILYEALTGTRAFAGKSTVDTLHKIIHADPPSVRSIHPELPAELQRITRKCLAKDPDERYQSAKDLAIDLRAAVRELGSAPDVTAAQPPRRNGAALVISVVVLVAIVVAVAWFAAKHEQARSAPVLSVRTLTSSGDVIEAAISPDGKYVSYVVSRKGQQSLWLRQIGTSQSIQLIPPATVAYWGHAFSPDGTSIYYATKAGSELGELTGTLFRIPMLGGSPQRILSGIESVVSFSPDRNRITYLRADFPRPGQSALMIANADGGGERLLAVKSVPEILAPIFFAGPAWSPDGRVIATAVVRSAGEEQAHLSLFDINNGAERALTKIRWIRAAQCVWTPDGSGLIAIANTLDSARPQLWRLAYPSGEARQITTGASEYRNPSISADGKAVVAVAAQPITTVYIKRLDGPNERRIGPTQYDGYNGVAFAPDGRIVFTSFTASGTELWISDQNGDARRQFVTGNVFNREPVVTKDGKVVFIGHSERGMGLWTMNLDGSGLTMLTPVSYSTFISASPDGKMVYFNSDFGQGPLLYRVPVTGGKPELVSTIFLSNVSVSRDGRFVAAAMEVGSGIKLGILDLATRKMIKTFEFNGSGYTRIRWSLDDKTIYFNTNSVLKAVDVATGRTSIVFGYEPPDLLNAFDIGRDGTLVLSHGPFSRDAYLVTGF